MPAWLFGDDGNEELIAADAEAAVSAATSRGKAKRLATGDLAEVFGIDLHMPIDKTENGAMKKTAKRTRTTKKNDTQAS